ncbi:MAG TPA: cyclase family protein [Acidimicrobiia bacterium]|jgi:kynurenine formamidase
MTDGGARPDSPPGNWGRWGDDDERGALNLITPGGVRAAAAAVTTGRVYGLGIPIQPHGVPLLEYRGTPLRLTLFNESDDGYFAFAGAPPGTGSHEDLLVFASHTTSHIDALSHAYAEHRHYNGVAASEMKTHTGAGRLGIEKVDAFAGRGVLLDVAGLHGVDWLEPGTLVTAGDLEACAAREQVTVEPGDIVLVRTGYLDFWFARQPDVGWMQPGIGLGAAVWLAERDVVAVGADNGAVEVIPFDGDEYLAVHTEMLVRRGIYLLEYLNLADLARDRCYTGLFAVGPLKVTGATGSPVNPVFVG